MEARFGYANNVYGRVAHGGDGKLWMQYWLYYYFDSQGDFGQGVHEGDWEMIQVGLDDQLHPDEVVYSQHGGGERCDWGEVTSSDGFRPDVYVAQGSHASYIRPGHYDDPDPDDDANGDGTIDTPLLEDITDPPGWIEWPGRWGDSGNNSPLGPLFHGPAVERHPV